MARRGHQNVSPSVANSTRPPKAALARSVMFVHSGRFIPGSWAFLAASIAIAQFDPLHLLKGWVKLGGLRLKDAPGRYRRRHMLQSDGDILQIVEARWRWTLSVAYLIDFFPFNDVLRGASRDDRIATRYLYLVIRGRHQ